MKVGGYEGLKVKQARKKIARYISLFWEKQKKTSHEKYPGSLSDAIDNNWYDKLPKVIIVRRYCESEYCPIVPCDTPAIIEQFELCKETKREFLRLYR